MNATWHSWWALTAGSVVPLARPRSLSDLPTELLLDILDPLVSSAFKLAAPQPREVVTTLLSLCRINRTLYLVTVPFVYDCVSIKSLDQLQLLLQYGLKKQRRVRTFIYNGPLRGFPTEGVSLLLQHISPTIERLVLNLQFGMPLAAYNNPILDIRDVTRSALNLQEFGSFSSAGDEVVFPLRRRGRPPYVLHPWPSIKRIALLSMFMGSALNFDSVLPSVEALALPCQALDESSAGRLHMIVGSWSAPKRMVWVCHQDEPEEGDTAAWFLFNFLPLADEVARKNREKVVMVCVHAPVSRGGLGRWMQQRMLDGTLWSLEGQVLGKGTALGRND